jgi:hypothetical protein
MRYLITILAALIIGCTANDPGPELDAYRVINPAGGFAYLTYTAEGDTLRYSFSDTAFIGLPDGDRWRWHEVIGGSMPIDQDGRFTFTVAAYGDPVTVWYIGVE